MYTRTLLLITLLASLSFATSLLPAGADDTGFAVVELYTSEG